jgi:hypothetical protein
MQEMPWSFKTGISHVISLFPKIDLLICFPNLFKTGPKRQERLAKRVVPIAREPKPFKVLDRNANLAR